MTCRCSWRIWTERKFVVFDRTLLCIELSHMHPWAARQQEVLGIDERQLCNLEFSRTYSQVSISAAVLFKFEDPSLTA